MVTPIEQPDSKLAQLLDAERRARERHERLAGYPDDVREAAHALWMEATEAVRAYRERRRDGGD